MKTNRRFFYFILIFIGNFAYGQAITELQKEYLGDNTNFGLTMITNTGTTGLGRYIEVFVSKEGNIYTCEYDLNYNSEFKIYNQKMELIKKIDCQG